MAYWLLKSEPDTFSWTQQLARGASGEPWTGVRNHQAKGFLAAMQPGDLAFFYHTGQEKQIVGIVTVTRGAYPDPTDPKWLAVDVCAKEALQRPVTLAAIKARADLADMALIRLSRLSVQPVTDAHWAQILAMGA